MGSVAVVFVGSNGVWVVGLWCLVIVMVCGWYGCVVLS